MERSKALRERQGELGGPDERGMVTAELAAVTVVVAAVLAGLLVGLVRGLTVYVVPPAAEASMYLLMLMVLRTRKHSLVSAMSAQASSFGLFLVCVRLV